MTQRSNETIRTPLTRRFRLWRQRYLPVVVWLVALVVAFALLQRQQHHIHATGFVEARMVIITPLVDGTVQSLSVDTLDYVEAGQPVALLDDTFVIAELRVAEAELGQLRAELDAKRIELELDARESLTDEQNAERRLALNEEEARIDLLDRVIKHEADEVALQRLKTLADRQRALLEESLIDSATYDDTRLRYETLKTEYEHDKSAIALGQENLAAAKKRQEEQADDARQGFGITESLAVFAERISVQEARISEIQERRRMLTLTAPLAGQVSVITRRPGESVLSGDPVLTITDTTANRVFAYVSENVIPELAIGDAVEIYSRRHPVQITEGTILKIGSQVEAIPPRLQTSPFVVQHGIQLLISIGDLPQGTFLPGEALNLRFRADS
jgi:multidrug resistance efflux pump